MNLLNQFYMLQHWDRSGRSNFLSHPVTVHWNLTNQSRALTLQSQTPGRAAMIVPIFMSLVWLDCEKQALVPLLLALEAGALPLGHWWPVYFEIMCTPRKSGRMLWFCMISSKEHGRRGGDSSEGRREEGGGGREGGGGGGGCQQAFLRRKLFLSLVHIETVSLQVRLSCKISDPGRISILVDMAMPPTNAANLNTIWLYGRGYIASITCLRSILH